MSDIRFPKLAPQGMKKIEWVREFMPVLARVEQRFIAEKPFSGMRITVSVHAEAKTAYLAMVLRSGGAEVFVTGCNPLSTKDEICAALASLGIETFGWHGATAEEYEEHLIKALSCKPDIMIDDGGDLTGLLHGDYPHLAENLIAGCEETTTGIHRLRARKRAGKLNFPMFLVNDAKSKTLFDNIHGTGQSVWDGIMYSTNNMVTGKTVVVAGYGHCGRGIADRAKGLGACVIVTEIDPHCCLSAAMDGHRVMKMADAAPLGDVFVTATGCSNVITREHFERMKNNAILANAGHFDCEISKPDLEALSERIAEERKPFIRGYYMKDGRVLNLMADGRLVNIVAGNGHPAEIMDLSFSIQALTLEHAAKNKGKLNVDLYDVPAEIDREVATLKLEAMQLGMDKLTDEQAAYFYGTGDTQA
ncbi:MAG: adenosylhomocysteinase [Oscillospiraceae bacterium]|nr:adenosylhomocysteinase [Oscillospiraceae bacterium]